MKEYQSELGKASQRRQNVQVQADLAAQNRKWDIEREIQALQVIYFSMFCCLLKLLKMMNFVFFTSQTALFK